MDSELKSLCKSFFEILDTTEESFSERRVFHPTYVHMDSKPPFKVTIPCCRVMRVQELDKLLRRMKELANDL